MDVDNGTMREHIYEPSYQDAIRDHSKPGADSALVLNGLLLAMQGRRRATFSDPEAPRPRAGWQMVVPCR